MGYPLNRDVGLLELLSMLDGNNSNVQSYVINSVANSSNAKRGSLSFISHERAVIDNEALYIGPVGIDVPNLIESVNPRLDFVRVLSFLNQEIGFSHFKFSKRIDPTVTIGQNVCIEDGVEIGARTHIDHNVVIKNGTRIGEDCYIGASTTLGTDGFGYEKFEDGTAKRFVHLGGVKIGDRVEIGSLNSVVRGTLSDTIIGDEVKTDNLVHIAHNCVIGRRGFLTACAELSGSVVLGDDVWIGPNSSINNKIRVGSDAFVGLGTVVIRDVEDGATVAGSPARRLS